MGPAWTLGLQWVSRRWQTVAGTQPAQRWGRHHAKGLAVASLLTVSDADQSALRALAGATAGGQVHARIVLWGIAVTSVCRGCRQVHTAQPQFPW